MKKLILGTAILASLCAMSACSSNDNCKDKSCKASDADEMVYTGVLPAADADGVRYTLKLDYDDNFREGDYDLVETYLKGDTTATAGFNDEKSFKSEGDFKVVEKDGMKYLRLIAKARKKSAGSKADNLCFMVDSDSTLTLVNDSLESSTNAALNYTLKLVK